MNRWLRLLWMSLTWRWRAKLSPFDACRTPFRVWFPDLDVFMHMNNGMYLTLMDLGRIDLMLRSGFWQKVKARGWYMVVVAETIQFRRSLNLFQRFEIETRLVGWDDKAMLVEQQFWRAGEPVAHALVRMRFLKRSGGNVGAAEAALATGLGVESPPLAGYAALWNAEQGGWKGARRADS